MKAAAILQAVIILMIVATAASCATGKEYADRVFAKRTEPAKDSVRIRFIERDSVSFSDEDGFIAVQKEKPVTDSISKDEPEVVTGRPAPTPAPSSGERARRKRE